MQRKLPLLTAENRPFWQGGADGVLQICHCDACSRYFHPPAVVCPRCQSRKVGPQPVSGRGQVFSYTVNHQPWIPELAAPFVVAIVELEEQPGLRFLSNLVGDEPMQGWIGMPVHVVFEQVEDVWLPLFEADRAGEKQ